MNGLKSGLAVALLFTCVGWSGAVTAEPAATGTDIENPSAQAAATEGAAEIETQGTAADSEGISAASVRAPARPFAETAASPASAGTTLAQLTGTVQRIDQNQRLLEVRGDNGQTVSLVASASTASDLQNLAVDDRVQVRYDQTSKQVTEINAL